MRKKKPRKRKKIQPDYRPGLFDHRFLYLMLHSRRPVVKIGISESPARRASEINETIRGQVLPLFWFRVYRAEYWEQKLHALFRPFSRAMQGSGKTEYFAMFPTLLIAPPLMFLLYFYQKIMWPTAVIYAVLWLLAKP